MCTASQPVCIERLSHITADAVAILSEYYEAVHVIQRDTPAALDAILHGKSSGIWLARLNQQVVGCVVLRDLPSIPAAAECKRLYVQPHARGHRIAEHLMDALESFARTQAVDWIYLDSHHDFRAAIALYKKRGYTHCDRYNNNPQATVFLRKHLA